MAMLCLVRQQNSVLLEIELDSKGAVGQDCLDKVLSHLGIIESDYFGLQYIGARGEHLWLNLRNPISRQLGGTVPYRLQLRVKFFVQPHFLLQDSTRHQFYLNVKHDLVSGSLKCQDVGQLAQMTGLMAQVEFGDFVPQRAHLLLTQYGSLLPEGSKDMELLSQVIAEHDRCPGLSERTAKYRLLQAASSLEGYGVEYHSVVNVDTGKPCRMGVGPAGISVQEDGQELMERIEYQGLHRATHDGRQQLTFTLLCDDASTTNLTFRLVSQRAASALYRCVTEMHSFYRCDTVRNAVASQVSRDLKGTLAALFSENTTLGQKYVFDIQRTMREAHDHARRVLYALENDLQTTAPDDLLPDPAQEAESGALEACPAGAEGGAMEMMDTQEAESNRTHLACTSSQCHALRETVQHLREVFICQICADAPINTVFLPCGHVVCCGECAGRMDYCPLCRAHISQSHPIFLPHMPSTSLSQHQPHSIGGSTHSLEGAVHPALDLPSP